MSEPQEPPNGHTNGTPKSASGWDGKLRVNKQATLANPEALEDSDYSDEDAPPAEQIDADEDLLEGEDPEVEEIELLHSKITSIPALRLERFKNLKRLCLRQNQIQHIELPDTCKTTLEELELYDNLLKHIDGVEEYTELRTLDLSYNKLKHIKRVSTLKKLDHLFFVQNRISKIEGLEELTDLTYLELGANRIREIDGLETLTKLESLWLGQNKISELKGLSTLTNLRTLSIQANRLTSLDGIEALPQLTELYISDNKVTSLEPLKACTKLEILDFQTNPITYLAGLEDLKDLENVWASNCQIESFQEVERALKDKEKLEEVYFEGNPLQRHNPVLYRNKVRLALPQISKIDAMHHSIRRDLLGGEVLYTRTLKNSPDFDVVGIPDAEFNIAMVSIGGYMIELLEYTAPEDRKHYKPRACDIGNVHVALEVKGSRNLIEKASKLGWKAANSEGPQEIRRTDKSLWSMIYLFGPDGVTVELMEKLG